MMTNNAADVKSDMLTVSSTVQEILRALYFYGTDYIMSVIGRRERLIHKEQLVALLENGKENSTLEDIMSVVLNEPLAAKTLIEDIPQETVLLIFQQAGGESPGALSRSTFEEYRERKIKESEFAFPEWWGIPLPILHIFGDRVYLNDPAYDLVSGDVKYLADQISRIRQEKIIVLKGPKHEKTFALYQMTDDAFLMEDISGDFEMAEDLIWWASVGKTLFRRMEENGLLFKRLTPLESPPENSAEVISCMWEGELLGRLSIELPDDLPERTGEREHGESENSFTKTDESSAESELREEEPPELSDALPQETYSEDAPVASAGSVEEINGARDYPDNLTGLNKNAARKAYGGTRRHRKTKKKEAPDNGVEG
ncbi:MAG: hypothetical protein LBQ58_01410 [Synergistaceae bacterium]|jgi:hypothetical protein|nr:hypothetical protein [Synergistaceae bacterium]